MLGRNSIYEWIQWLKQGYKSIYIRSDTESAIERGVMFYFHKPYPKAATIGAGQSRYIIFKTGNTPITVRERQVAYAGEEFSLELFSGVTVNNDSYGTPLIPSNFIGTLGKPSTIKIWTEPDIATEGTPLQATPEYYYGASTPSGTTGITLGEGRIRKLALNTYYLIKITNTGGQSGRFTYYLDWTEEQSELPYYRSPLNKDDYFK